MSQRCKCGWTGKRIRFSCPKCNKFLSIPKGVKAKDDPRKKTTKGRARIQYEDGFRLHRDPKGKGWSFIEGKSQRDAPVFLSGQDAEKINSCAVRRGLIKSRRWM